jgi:hypothetical protein
MAIEDDDGGGEVVKVSEIQPADERATELGLTIPEEVAALPGGFYGGSVEQMRYVSTTLDLKAALKGEGIDLGLIKPEGTKIPFTDNRFDTWIGPILVFGAGMMVNKPELVLKVLEVVYNHVADGFRGMVGLKRAKINYVVNTPDGKTHEIEFDGPVDQLPEVYKIVKGMMPPKPGGSTRAKPAKPTDPTLPQSPTAGA